MRQQSVRARVANGARWLDENFPGWEDRIDIDTLDLSRATACICGQVFEHKARRRRLDRSGYEYAYDNLFSEANGWITTLVETAPISRRSVRLDKSRRANNVSTALGFSPSCPGKAWSTLQREWKRLLRERRAARED